MPTFEYNGPWQVMSVGVSVGRNTHMKIARYQTNPETSSVPTGMDNRQRVIIEDDDTSVTTGFSVAGSGASAFKPSVYPDIDQLVIGYPFHGGSGSVLQLELRESKQPYSAGDFVRIGPLVPTPANLVIALSPEAGSPGVFTAAISWDAVPGVTRYQVTQWSSGETAPRHPRYITTNSVTAYSFQYKTTVWVRPFSLYPSRSAHMTTATLPVKTGAAAIVVVPGTTPTLQVSAPSVAKPGNVTFTARTGGVRASWDAVTGATSYGYSYTIVGLPGSTEVTGTTTSTSLDIDSDEEVVFKVKVTTSAGTSAYTDAATWTPAFSWASSWWSLGLERSSDDAIFLLRDTRLTAVPAGLDPEDPVILSSGANDIRLKLTPIISRSQHLSGGFSHIVPENPEFYSSRRSGAPPGGSDPETPGVGPNQFVVAIDVRGKQSTLPSWLTTAGSLVTLRLPSTGTGNGNGNGNGVVVTPDPVIPVIIPPTPVLPAGSLLLTALVRTAGSEDYPVRTGFVFSGLTLVQPVSVSTRVFEVLIRSTDLPPNVVAATFYGVTAHLRGVFCGLHSVSHEAKSGIWTLKMQEIPSEAIKTFA